MDGNADREHEGLWSIAGEWATDGHVVGDPPMPVRGTDAYEVLAGGYFLVHHVDATVGDQQVRAIEVIGERPSRAVTSWPVPSTTKGTPKSCGWPSTTRACSTSRAAQRSPRLPSQPPRHPLECDRP